jgi:glycosyltransferase involved in cell wall biosynthesis
MEPVRARKLISVVCPCFNEEGNVRELHEQVREVFRKLDRYDYEQIFIDNSSKDGTVAILREIAASDPRVKVIVNIRNFGHIRSPYHAILQAKGDAIVCMASDLQDPPAMIADFLECWEKGFRVAVGVKLSTQDSWTLGRIRRFYYDLLSRLSDVELVKNSTGFGLYDRKVIELIREMREPYPYFRGLIAELGFPVATIPYDQPARKRGITSNNFYTLFDLAMLGFTTHTKVPLRLATIAGFGMSVVSFLIGMGYLVAKLLFWNRFSFGMAPILIGIFLAFSVELFFLGLLGEYIGALHTQSLRRPIVVEKERINFDEGNSTPE